MTDGGRCADERHLWASWVAGQAAFVRRLRLRFVAALPGSSERRVRGDTTIGDPVGGAA